MRHPAHFRSRRGNGRGIRSTYATGNIRERFYDDVEPGTGLAGELVEVDVTTREHDADAAEAWR
jgi:hypothetical protein